MIFVTTLDGTAVGQTVNVSQIGYYYFDAASTAWKSITGATDNIYVADGTLTSNRTMSMGGNNLNLVGGRVAIGTTVPEAALDVISDSGGVAVPRMSNSEITALTNPAKSSIVYNTSTDQLNYNSGTPALPIWSVLQSSARLSNLYLSTTTQLVPLLNTPTFINNLAIESNMNPSSYTLDTTTTPDRIIINQSGTYQVCGAAEAPVGPYFRLGYTKNNTNPTGQIILFTAYHPSDGGHYNGYGCDSRSFATGDVVRFVAQSGQNNTTIIYNNISIIKID